LHIRDDAIEALPGRIHRAAAVELADQVSLKLESPNQARFSDLAPDKEFAGSMWGAWPGPPS
jgi:hypothetical protein